MNQTPLLDTSGLLCPLPVLKLRKRLRDLRSGEELTVVATDPAASVDVPHFCNEAGHELVEQTREGDSYRFVVRKA